MSWLLNLHATYEANLGQVGKIERKRNKQEYTLLPVSHTTQNAHIEVLVTEAGDFYHAEVIDKENASTLIPCTEDAANRAGSKVAPYPLHDKLSYVAGDYEAYGGEVKAGKNGDQDKPYPVYIKQLQEWAESPYATDAVRSIYAYLRKGCLIEDLVRWKVLHLDNHNRLLAKWDSALGEKPPIFGVVGADQGSAFVRFTLYAPDKHITAVWRDEAMYNSFVQFYRERLADAELCYVMGEQLPATDKHANKIRNAADKAKLISANDTSGFTYRGRFSDSSQVASISYEVSQKAHNALKWLINRQGRFAEQRVFLVWGNRDEGQLPQPTDDFFDLDPEVAVVKDFHAFTHERFAKEVAKAMTGYRNDVGSVLYKDASVNILVLDSATTGRMAVLYYRNMDKHLYLDRLVKWHTKCSWLHRYRKNDEDKFISFYGAPSLKDIAFAAYGPRADDRVKKEVLQRLLPCVVDNAALPQDIVAHAFRRASNPVAMERWEWNKTLSIACALINVKEAMQVALDKTSDDRDYLFGRLLAVADILERRALGPEETRATNAIRYMNVFAQHPARTWKTIQASLQPYQARLGRKAQDLNKIIDEIGSKMPVEAFTNTSLSEKYLLGFYSQRHDYYMGRSKAAQAAEGDPSGEAEGAMDTDGSDDTNDNY